MALPVIRNGLPLINTDGTPALCRPDGCCREEEGANTCEEYFPLMQQATECHITFGSDNDFVLQCSGEPDMPFGTFIVPKQAGSYFALDTDNGIGVIRVVVSVTCGTTDGEPDPIGDRTFYVISTSICNHSYFRHSCASNQGSALAKEVSLSVGVPFALSRSYIIDTAVSWNGIVGLCGYGFGGGINPTARGTVYNGGVTVSFT